MKLAAAGLWIATIFFTSGLLGENTIVDTSTKETFPSEVSFDQGGKHYDLEATGVATRKKLIIKVYSLASYLQKGAASTKDDRLAAILSDDNAKQLTMKWVRDVGPEQVKESYQEAFHKVFSEQAYAQQKNNIDDFLKIFLVGAKKGDIFILRWAPGGYVEALINGKTAGTVTNKEFAQGLWKIWFGDNSVVNRSNLLSQ